MSDKPKVLIQLDSDNHPSVFDSIVAIDSGVDHLLRFGMVEPLDVRELIHGAMFTRGAKSLGRTAVFIGGNKVQTGEQILRSVKESFFGPIRVSVMLDANGANTTSAAAVLTLQKHLPLANAKIAVLAATGSVGSRVVRLLAKSGAQVNVGSRSLERANKVCADLKERNSEFQLQAFETEGPRSMQAILDGCQGLVSAGAAGIEIVAQRQWQAARSLSVLVDLNAVPPAGIQGVDPTAAGSSDNQVVLYGAIGVGNLKMQIHKTSITRLFESNDNVLNVDEIFEIGQALLRESM